MSRQRYELIQAQETIDRRGDRTHPAPLEPVMAIIIMAAAALVYAAVTGRLDAAGAQLFKFVGL